MLFHAGLKSEHLSGLEIATDMVANYNVTNIFSLATKNSGLVPNLATRFLYYFRFKLED